ncbi:hypothetical protein [Paenibacillus sp. NPDC058071]|uniref:hypothetical protein n=1 Tax=Paenibacillus sp. NPDC058071 TaxID=3346326 RepID=UPI0036DDB21D
MEKGERICRLREIEVLCYRFCYALLGSEAGAHQAAKEALLRIWEDERFFASCEKREREQLVRRHASSVCLTLFRSELAPIGV